MKNKKGITLVSLIITILVMLILTAVIITTAISENGIIDRAENALIEKERSEIEELVKMSYVFKTTASQTTYAYLDLEETADAIYGNLTSNGFTVKTEEGEEATSGTDIYNPEDTSIELNVKGKTGEFEGKIIQTGLEDEIKVKEVSTKINKTLNNNLEEFKEAFDEGFYYRTWKDSIVQSAKLTYTNGTETITINAGWNDTVPSALNIYLVYTNANLEKFQYACSITGSPRGTVENASCAGTIYPFVEKGRWQMFKGKTFTNSSGYGFAEPIYEDFEETVIFEGNWIIDENKSNDLGKQYFEKVLIDVK